MFMMCSYGCHGASGEVRGRPGRGPLSCGWGVALQPMPSSLCIALLLTYLLTCTNCHYELWSLEYIFTVCAHRGMKGVLGKYMNYVRGDRLVMYCICRTEYSYVSQVGEGRTSGLITWWGQFLLVFLCKKVRQSDAVGCHPHKSHIRVHMRLNTVFVQNLC